MIRPETILVISHDNITDKSVFPFNVWYSADEITFDNTIH